MTLNLSAVFESLNESDARLLREILLTDEPPVTREEAEECIDELRCDRVREYLALVQEALTDTNHPHWNALLKFKKGLERILAPEAKTARALFCRYMAEKEKS
jgi:hypothetical protein